MKPQINILGVFTVLFFLTTHILQSDDYIRYEPKPILKRLLKQFDDLQLSILIDAYNEDNKPSEIHIYQPNIDYGKTIVADGMHQGYAIRKKGTSILKEALEQYPIVPRNKAIDQLQFTWTDYEGMISCKGKGGGNYFLIGLGYGNSIDITEYNQKREKVDALSGDWINCELTIYRICEAMQNRIHPTFLETMRKGKPKPETK